MTEIGTNGAIHHDSSCFVAIAILIHAYCCQLAKCVLRFIAHHRDMFFEKQLAIKVNTQVFDCLGSAKHVASKFKLDAFR